MKYDKDVLNERPMSEGDQIKSTIRELFCNSREGVVYTESAPLKRKIVGVNGVAEKNLCIYKHETKHGAIVMWYEDV